MNRITVERISEDRLSRQFWEFWYSESYHQLLIGHYVSQTRPTTRHKFRDDWGSRYNRISHSRLKVVDVPLPDDVQREALQQFIATLTVVKT